MSGRPVVAIVGAGASGCLTATHAARAARAAGRAVEILLVDPGPLGQGLAFSTPDPRHRLNVPAKGMSALPDDPEHFLRWLRRHVHLDFPAGGFAPRLHYADYLQQTLEEFTGLGSDVQVEHVRDAVRDLRRHGRRLRLTLADGTSRPADAVVLAMGHGAPSTSWVPEPLRRSPHFVADPWRASSAPTVRTGDHVLLVGAGLTMADMAQRWGRRGVTLHVASRHGMLPLPHADQPQPPLPALELPDAGQLSLAQVRRLVFRHVRAAGGDWRRAIDGLRPVTSALWSAMDDDARRGFLRTAARRWDRVRHRVDPALSGWLQQRVEDGSLVVHAAEVTDAIDDGDRIVVELSDGTRQRFAAVLNCTGTCVGMRSSDDPLVLNLLNSATARPGSLDLGFATDAGRLLAGTVRRPRSGRSGRCAAASCGRAPPSLRSARRRPRWPPLRWPRCRRGRCSAASVTPSGCRSPRAPTPPCSTTMRSATSCAFAPAPRPDCVRRSSPTRSSRSGTPRSPCSGSSGVLTSTSRPRSSRPCGRPGGPTSASSGLSRSRCSECASRAPRRRRRCSPTSRPIRRTRSR